MAWLAYRNQRVGAGFTCTILYFDGPVQSVGSDFNKPDANTERKCVVSGRKFLGAVDRDKAGHFEGEGI